jgi:hypothetical protein
MSFRYYDTLSQITIGYIVLVVCLYLLGYTYDNTYSVPYFAGAFIVGYFVNALSSLLENFYNWTIGGKPSNKLLRTNPKKDYSGISKVRFYQTVQVVTLLQQEAGDSQANEGKMFAIAMRFSNSNEKSRVPDFNAHYAFSRVILTTTIIVTLLLLFRFYCHWEVYLSMIPLLLSWNRYRERGYYYAREVLNEYLKKHTATKPQ